MEAEMVCPAEPTCSTAAPTTLLHLVMLPKLVGIEALEPLLQTVVVDALEREVARSWLPSITVLLDQDRRPRLRSASAIASLGRASTATCSPLHGEMDDGEERVARGGR